MRYKNLCTAIEEAERFLKRAKRSKAAAVLFTPEPSIPNIEPWLALNSPVDDAATKRSSMDLTRALAKLRK
jgi:hypothetical protein